MERFRDFYGFLRFCSKKCKRRWSLSNSDAECWICRKFLLNKLGSKTHSQCNFVRRIRFWRHFGGPAPARGLKMCAHTQEISAKLDHN